MGAKDEHTLKAFLEAEAYDGPALIIAYSHCIAHGINMTTAMQNQKAAVNSGQWLLYRYNPERARRGENPLQLDSPAPRVRWPIISARERFKMLDKSDPRAAKELFQRRRRRMWTRAAASTNFSPTRELQTRHQSHEPNDHLSRLQAAHAARPFGVAAVGRLDNIKRMEDAGASAVVFHSLFEEQMRQDHHELHYYLEQGTESYAEALTYFPEPEEFKVGPEAYLEHIAQAKAAVKFRSSAA